MVIDKLNPNILFLLSIFSSLLTSCYNQDRSVSVAAVFGKWEFHHAEKGTLTSNRFDSYVIFESDGRSLYHKLPLPDGFGGYKLISGSGSYELDEKNNPFGQVKYFHEDHDCIQHLQVFGNQNQFMRVVLEHETNTGFIYQKTFNPLN
ncbi:MAG: hypothetical protein AAFY98_09595 [Verrucomicrobiota bacterium]